MLLVRFPGVLVQSLGAGKAPEIDEFLRFVLWGIKRCYNYWNWSDSEFFCFFLDKL
jgi:hypothetical protein